MTTAQSVVRQTRIAIVLLLTLGVLQPLPAQSNGPCQIVYLVRDAKGDLMDPALRESIEAPQGDEMKPGTTFLLTPRGEFIPGVKCLASKLDIGGKPVKLSTLTLKLGGKTMRLDFNLQIVEEKRYVDSLPFQEGHFKLVDGKWAGI